MTGVDPRADFLFHLEFAALFAVLGLAQAWTLTALVACVPLGAVLRGRFERRSVVWLGVMVVLGIVALTTAVLGLDLSDGPDVFRQTWPAYFFPLVLMLCWLLHVPIGLFALGLGIGGAEVVARLFAGRHRPASTVSDRGRDRG